MGLFDGINRSPATPAAPEKEETPFDERRAEPRFDRVLGDRSGVGGAGEDNVFASAPAARSDTLIAEGTVVSGSISGEGAIHVEGTVDGKIDMTGSVLITATGKVKGPIEASVIQVAGRVEGSIKAHSHLCLKNTGRIDGDVNTTSFVIDDGGILNGRATMTSDAPAPAKPAAAPKPAASAPRPAPAAARPAASAPRTATTASRPAAPSAPAAAPASAAGAPTAPPAAATAWERLSHAGPGPANPSVAPPSAAPSEEKK